MNVGINIARVAFTYDFEFKKMLSSGFPTYRQFYIFFANFYFYLFLSFLVFQKKSIAQKFISKINTKVLSSATGTTISKLTVEMGVLYALA